MEYIDGVMHFGGLSVESLMREYGSPLYVYEEGVIQDRFRRMRNSFSAEQVEIHYAMKANYNPSLLALLRDLGASVDTVSPWDVRLALELGFNPGQILFTGDNTSFAEVEYCVRNEVPVNLGSLELLRLYGERYPGTQISVRINPGMGAGHHAHCITGGPESKFGIYYESVNNIFSQADKHGLTLIGVHSHIGTGIRHPEQMLAAMELVLDVAKDFPDLEFIDFGGGFDIPYRDDQAPLDIEELGRAMMMRFRDFCAKYRAQLKMKIEPGRYLVGPAGTLLATVTDISETPQYRFVGIDTGFNHLIRPILYGSYHRIINATRGDLPHEEVVVAGNICESGDIFSRAEDGVTRKLSCPEIGNRIAILDAGAYGMSMASNYNLRPLPAEVLVSQGQARLIRRGTRFEDMMQPYPDFC